ncbi:MAG TPA: hypothetical protein QF361_05210 [Gammaproteobacteria bacterium]|nr:hypothetical protein [Gammaproteobacteria bacterium]
MTATVGQWLAAHPRRLALLTGEPTVAQAMALMLAEPGRRDVYVVADGVPVGHIALRRLASVALASYLPRPTRGELLVQAEAAQAGAFVEQHFPLAREDEPLEVVIHRLLEADVQEMPVLTAAADRLLGGLDLLDVLREQQALMATAAPDS